MADHRLMAKPKNSTHLRRPTVVKFIKTSGKVAGASALAGVAIPHVHAGVGDAVKVALVECRWQGTDVAMAR